jgi:hypothetical protein
LRCASEAHDRHSEQDAYPHLPLPSLWAVDPYSATVPTQIVSLLQSGCDSSPSAIVLEECLQNLLLVEQKYLD